jgi:hypothetical protein
MKLWYVDMPQAEILAFDETPQREAGECTAWFCDSHIDVRSEVVDVMWTCVYTAGPKLKTPSENYRRLVFVFGTKRLHVNPKVSGSKTFLIEQLRVHTLHRSLQYE